MSTQGSRGVDQQAIEQLLAGVGTGPLADVLRVAAAPAHPEELTGEDAAVAAFREADLVRATATTTMKTALGRQSALRTFLGRLLTVKAMVAVAVVGTTGIVLAATGGVVPAPWPVMPVEQPHTTTSTSEPPVQPTHRLTPPGSLPSPSTVSPPSSSGAGLPLTGSGGHHDKPHPTTTAKSAKDTKPPKNTKTSKTDKPGATPTVGKPKKTGGTDVTKTHRSKKPDKGSGRPVAGASDIPRPARSSSAPPAPDSPRGAADGKAPSSGAELPSQGG
jgi:hypothetical protein